jgi:release factor glutamine methyltransferase
VNLKIALASVRKTLENAKIEDAALEGEILLRHVLNVDRARLFSHLDEKLTQSQANALKSVLERRLNGEPAAYITGRREFFGLDFIVTPGVLVPRPETELLVEKALSLAKTRKISSIADIGTGSGAIAVSVAVNLPSATIYATDISMSALAVARQNASKHGVADRIIFLQGDMLAPLPRPVDLIIANLPYVSTSELPSLKFEPALALDGGTEGMDKLGVFCRQSGDKLSPGGSILMEVGREQSERVMDLLAHAFPSAKIKAENDLAGIERVIIVCL